MIPMLDNRSECFEKVSDVHPDLSDDIFRSALARAYEEHCSMMNGFFPPSGIGQAMYQYGTGFLRENFSRLDGWKCENNNNIARITNKATGITIICTGGDESTGIVHKMPSTKSRKGKASASLVGQLSLFEEYISPQVEQVWYLLNYPDVQNHEIRCELSLPQPFKPNSKVIEWTQRIILEPIIIGAVEIDPALLEVSSETLDIPVRFRKAQ